MVAVPAQWVAEAGGSQAGGQPEQLSKNPSQKRTFEIPLEWGWGRRNLDGNGLLKLPRSGRGSGPLARGCLRYPRVRRGGCAGERAERQLRPPGRDPGTSPGPLPVRGPTEEPASLLDVQGLPQGPLRRARAPRPGCRHRTAAPRPRPPRRSTLCHPAAGGRSSAQQGPNGRCPGFCLSPVPSLGGNSGGLR